MCGRKNLYQKIHKQKYTVKSRNVKGSIFLDNVLKKIDILVQIERDKKNIELELDR